MMEMQTAKIIGIAGPSCGGKTSIARMLANMLENLDLSVLLVKMDNYYRGRPKDAGPDYSFDVPEALNLPLLHQHMTSLIRGESVMMPNYKFGAGPTTYDEIEGAFQVIIVEGLFVLQDEAIRDLCASKLFVTASEAICLKRRIARDSVGRNQKPDEEIEMQWNEQVIPGRRQYVDPSLIFADTVITNEDPTGLPNVDGIAVTLHKALTPAAA